MAVILQQDGVDDLVQVALELQAKQLVADTAKDKIREMYLDTCVYRCFENMDTMESIGLVIKDIAQLIDKHSIYFPSFMMLKQSYELKLVKG